MIPITRTIINPLRAPPEELLDELSEPKPLPTFAPGRLSPMGLGGGAFTTGCTSLASGGGAAGWNCGGLFGRVGLGLPPGGVSGRRGLLPMPGWGTPPPKPLMMRAPQCGQVSGGAMSPRPISPPQPVQRHTLTIRGIPGGCMFGPNGRPPGRLGLGGPGKGICPEAALQAKAIINREAIPSKTSFVRAVDFIRRPRRGIRENLEVGR